MATLVSDLRAQLKREVNIPGFEQLPDVTSAELDGYIKDGFWEARLLGMLDGYTQTDGSEFATPTGAVIKKTSDSGDLEEYLQQLVVMIAGFKMIRLKILNLAINIRGVAGPVEFEQQASATTLRAILQSMSDRLEQIKQVYSDDLSQGVSVYFDSVLQRESSELQGLLITTVL